MHGGHFVEEIRLDQLQSRLEQLGADDHGEATANEEHRQREDQIQRADVLVIGGHAPAREEILRRAVMIVVVIVGGCVGHGLAPLPKCELREHE
ncbi:hypothetical protein [Dyella silvatica]|uniref:hypothetical protein n=1 Tax=Dyella silvatica TaxID=2992128 RepID=UPI00224D1405|nr:hypothetical protein [Dyella silvatica]